MYILWNTDGCCSIKQIVSLSHRNWHPSGGFRKDSSNNADSDKSHSRVKRGLDVPWNQRHPGSQVL